MVLARIVDQHLGHRLGGGAVFQVGVEEGDQNVAAEVGGGVALPLQRPERVGAAVDLAVIPGAHHQVGVGGAVRGAERVPGVDGAIHVLLVPQALQPHGGHGRGMGGDQPVQRLHLPEGVVGRVGSEAAPERELVEAVRLGVGAGGAGIEEGLVVVVGDAGDRIALALHAGLAGDVVEVGLSEGAVVEPVVAHPAVDHRALGSRHLQRRMRAEQGHGDGPAVVGGADLADAAVGLRHVLRQPVGGVPGVAWCRRCWTG